MRTIVRHSSPLVYALIIALLSMSLPQGRAEAAMASTESVIGIAHDSQAERERVRAFLDRADVQAQLQAYGISPEEAVARVDALTDGEIALIAGKVDQLPAGGCYGEACGAAVLILLAAAVLVVVGLIAGIVWVFKWLTRAGKKTAEEPPVEPQRVE
jgi:hypothetical protein